MNMKTIFAAVIAASWLAGPAFADVVKSQKSEVTFKGFGTFSLASTDKITAERKLTEATSEFKGKGILGGLAAKTILRSGQTGEIIDLPAATITQIDRKRKEYTVTPLEKWAETQKQVEGGEPEPSGKDEAEPEIRIVRTEFKVTATGDSKTINGFDCRKFTALWTVEWENTRTKDKGTDRLETDLWTTPMTGALRNAQDEELAFSKAYFKAIGLDFEGFQRDVLGTQWMNILGSFDPANRKPQAAPDKAALAREMAKIEGYPIVVDGKYFAAPKAPSAEAQPEEGGGIGGKLGRLGAGLLKKKPDPAAENAPSLSFTTEITAVSAADVAAAEFQPPAGFKKK